MPRTMPAPMHNSCHRRPSPPVAPLMAGYVPSPRVTPPYRLPRPPHCPSTAIPHADFTGALFESLISMDELRYRAGRTQFISQTKQMCSHSKLTQSQFSSIN